MPRLIVHGFTISLARLAVMTLHIGVLASCTNRTSDSPELQSSPLEYLQGDTLTIEARFADCGEFGGPHETLMLFDGDLDEMIVQYSRDSVHCGEYPQRERVIVERRQAKMSAAKKSMTIAFIEEMVRRSFHSRVLSNGPDCYLIQRPSVFQSLALEYCDDGRDRAAFNKLREGLLLGK